MKITFDWLKDHLNTNLKEEKLLDQLTNIGLEVENVENLSSGNELFKIAHDRKGSLFDSLKLVFPNHDACRILDALVEDAKILTPYELIEKLLICYDGRLRMSARLGRSVNDILDEGLHHFLTNFIKDISSVYRGVEKKYFMSS